MNDKFLLVSEAVSKLSTAIKTQKKRLRNQIGNLNAAIQAKNKSPAQIAQLKFRQQALRNALGKIGSVARRI